MQGSGESSEARWTPFDSATTADVRNPVGKYRVSWKRAEDPTATFAAVGSSIVGGTDIVQGTGTEILNPDLFQYFDETDRVIRLEYDRELEEPLGGVSHGIVDALLDNTGRRFTPDYNQTIGTALDADRPMKFDLGFRFASAYNPDTKLMPDGIEVTVPIIRAQSIQRVKEDKERRQATMRGLDYMAFLEESPLEAATYENQRSDEIIEDILTNLGFGSSQFELDTGLNTIPFAWFASDKKAGKRIRELCEAEEAHFYQDEKGILRFENRRHLIEAPHNASVWQIHPKDILKWEEDNSTIIINRAIIKSRPRKIQSASVVWTGEVPLELASGESRVVWPRFTDELGEQKPVKTITTPVESTDYVANTASDGSGVNVSNQITITSVTNFVETARMTINNNYSGTVYLTTLQLRGQAAEVTQAIEEQYDDTTSQDKYEVNHFVVENNFIQDRDFAYYLARALVQKYSNPLKKIKITVRGIPHLQLKDRVTLTEPDLDTTSEYRVMKIQGVLDMTGFTQKIWLREITDAEAESPAVVGVSLVDGDDVVWV